MPAKAPATKRKFQGDWEQVDYLYHKVLYWYYDREDRAQAKRFADRLGPLIAKVDPHCEAILGASCRSIVAELSGDLWSAIQARQREIEMIRHYLTLDVPPSARLNPDELSDRLDLLAILYWESGELVRAAEILEESRRYCLKQGIPFDGQSLVDELEQERAETARNGSIRNRDS